MATQQRRIAVVGCGAAGLSAAYLLGRSEHVQLVLYEERAQLGGHANTVEVRRGAARRSAERRHHIVVGRRLLAVRSVYRAPSSPPRHPRPPPLSCVQVEGVPVDTGFLVYNESTYSNLIGMFEVRL